MLSSSMPPKLTRRPREGAALKRAAAKAAARAEATSKRVAAEQDKANRAAVRRAARRRKRAPIYRPTGPRLPLPSPAAPPVTTPARPQPAPAATPPPAADPLVYSGAFGSEQAERLLWRAGFGPRPGEAEQVAALGLREAVRRLVEPGPAVLTGPEPRVGTAALAPRDLDGHDHLWWLDRMVRSSNQLSERLALVFHDWFATTNADVNQRSLMLDQNELFRARGLGSFDELASAVTTDPAMLVFLDGIANRKGGPNENYARELLELFTLGADRGAYTETDIREAARALTGWRADYLSGTGYVNFRFDTARFDSTPKSIFGERGAFGWADVVRLALENPSHRSFFVLKLWSAFVPSPPDAATQAALEGRYVASGRSIRAIVEAILLHPDLYGPRRMVKPPAVFAAGLLRALQAGIVTNAWVSAGAGAGQRLFYPPNVSGWNDNAWLDTSTLASRWLLVAEAVKPVTVKDNTGYPDAETPEQALESARAFWARPRLSPESLDVLSRFAATTLPATTTTAAAANARGQRQNALRHLVAAAPDSQTS